MSAIIASPTLAASFNFLQCFIKSCISTKVQKNKIKTPSSLANSTSERRQQGDWLFWLTNQWPAVFLLQLLVRDQWVGYHKRSANGKTGWNRTVLLASSTTFNHKKGNNYRVYTNGHWWGELTLYFARPTTSTGVKTSCQIRSRGGTWFEN